MTISSPQDLLQPRREGIGWAHNLSEVERGRARPLMKKRLLQKASSGLPLSAHEKKVEGFRVLPPIPVGSRTGPLAKLQ